MLFTHILIFFLTEVIGIYIRIKLVLDSTILMPTKEREQKWLQLFGTQNAMILQLTMISCCFFLKEPTNQSVELVKLNTIGVTRT